MSEYDFYLPEKYIEKQKEIRDKILKKQEMFIFLDAPFVCLCGSTKFMKAYKEANFFFTMNLCIVLTVGASDKSDDELKLTEDDKMALDYLHKRKIDVCSFVFVLNVDGYIGNSTRSEIEYAKNHGKPVYYLEAPR